MSRAFRSDLPSSRERPSPLLGMAAVFLAAFGCTPTTEASDDATASTTQIVVEAFIVETASPIFDTRYEAVAKAARGRAADLVPAGSGVTLRERLESAEESGSLSILASPSFMVRSGESAHVQSGLQVPVQTVTSEAVTVQFVNATLRLEVAPTVLDDGKIALDISAQKRFYPGAPSTVGAPAAPIQTTEAHTRTLVADGGTAVVGGLFETREETARGEAEGRGDELVILVTTRTLDL